MTGPPRTHRFLAAQAVLLGLAACRSTSPERSAYAPSPVPSSASPASSATSPSSASPAGSASFASPATSPTSAGPAPAVAPAPLTQGVPVQAAPVPAAPAAATYPNMYRKAGLSVGASFLANFDTTVQVSGEAGVGAVLDLEDFLDVDDDYLVARADLFYAFTPRHRVDFSVYDIARDGKETLLEDIVVGDVTIPAGEVRTTIDTLIVKAAYRYNFVADERTAIGASFGFHTMGIDLGIESTDFAVDETFRATAPLPVIGLHAEYALSERWKLLGSVELFQIDIGFAQGYLADNRLAIEHDPFGHVGWGLALTGFQLDAEFEDDSLTGDLEYAYQGLFLYLRLYL